MNGCHSADAVDEGLQFLRGGGVAAAEVQDGRGVGIEAVDPVQGEDVEVDVQQ